MTPRIPRTAQAIAAYAAELIAAATECSTGNTEADGDLRNFADGLTDIASNDLEHGALWLLAASERERQHEAAQDAAAHEAAWQRLHLGRVA